MVLDTGGSDKALDLRHLQILCRLLSQGFKTLGMRESKFISDKFNVK
jgi:hypothetical protein